VKVLVLNGPNLGSLGTREPEIYGRQTLADLEAALAEKARALGCDLKCVQSNHEGVLIDALEQEGPRSGGIILNPGGLTHTSVALHDAIRACPVPVVEVHLSNLYAREAIRHESRTGGAAVGVITGLGTSGYLLALEYLVRLRPRRS